MPDQTEKGSETSRSQRPELTLSYLAELHNALVHLIFKEREKVLQRLDLLEDDVRELKYTTEDLDSRLSDIEEKLEESIYLAEAGLQDALPGGADHAQ